MSAPISTGRLTITVSGDGEHLPDAATREALAVIAERMARDEAYLVADLAVTAILSTDQTPRLRPGSVQHHRPYWLRDARTPQELRAAAARHAHVLKQRRPRPRSFGR